MVYWSLFNIEGESSQDAVYVTYMTLDDMLNDVNRIQNYYPDGGGASVNVIGTGSFVLPNDPAPVPATPAAVAFARALAGLGLWRRRSS